MSYGLSIYDEEDREEGRAIMRAMISPDEDDDEEEEDKEKQKDEEKEEEDEEGKFAHFADHHFDNKERAWVKKHYQNCAAFMTLNGLRWWNDDHRVDAKRLIKSFMSDDE